MPNPLNRTLYGLLSRAFGSVKISNEGQAMKSRYVYNRDRDRDELMIEDPGEYYLVCCPLCTDTTYRLSINHRWGVRDEQGRKNLWLVICYNEDCYASEQARQDLYEQVGRIDGVLERAIISPGKDYVAGEIMLPGPVFPLHMLAPSHAANVYLAGRFYEPERLGRFYGVGYCPSSYYSMARNRIVAPIYLHGKLSGWQARYIGETDWKSPQAPLKWFSDPRMRKSQLLYNYDVAKRYRTGVVTEGPGDVWSFGPAGMATFGSSMSLAQSKLLIDAYKDGSLILLWDPDVRHDPKKVKHIENKVIPWLDGKFRHGFGIVWLPDDTDPGKLSREFLREYVAKEARALGVKVDWRLK